MTLAPPEASVSTALSGTPIDHLPGGGGLSCVTVPLLFQVVGSKGPMVLGLEGGGMDWEGNLIHVQHVGSVLSHFTHVETEAVCTASHLTETAGTNKQLSILAGGNCLKAQQVGVSSSA